MYNAFMFEQITCEYDITEPVYKITYDGTDIFVQAKSLDRALLFARQALDFLFNKRDVDFEIILATPFEVTDAIYSFPGVVLHAEEHIQSR